MTLQQLKNEIEAAILVKEVQIGEEYIPHVASLTFDSNYIQILYDYGIDVLHVVLEILETNEIYEQCAVIRQTIIDTNKLESTNFPTTYKTDE